MSLIIIVMKIIIEVKMKMKMIVMKAIHVKVPYERYSVLYNRLGNNIQM